MRLINIKLFLLLMFFTGILQWDVLALKWENLKIISTLHIFISLFVSIFLIIPFVNRHAYKYIIIKKVNSLNGWILGLVLLLITLSGFYLFFVGNTGGDTLGRISFTIHLYGSFIFVALFFYHIRNQFSKQEVSTSLAGFLIALFLPTTSYSYDKTLTNIKLEKEVHQYHNEDWTNSTKCKSCHAEIFNQWADSNHKNMVDSNPYYMVMEGVAAETEGENFRQWCMGCHNPSALTTGLSKTSHPMDGNFLRNTLFEKNAQTLQKDYEKHGSIRLEEGVSCLMCHRIMDANSTGNASYSLDLTNRRTYPFENEDKGLGQYLGEKFINAKPEVHKQSYMKPLYKKSNYCASCHDETSPTTGKKIVATFQEWEKSPFNQPNNPKEHKSCIDCHMTNLENGQFKPLEGFSTTGGKLKKDVKVHYFSGSNHFLSGLKSKKHEDQTIQLLKTAAKIDIDIKDNTIFAEVKNVGAGHHLPTGVADFRELWLDITLTDSDGKIIFSSGKLKQDGNLSEDARPFMKVFGDKEGKPVKLLFWQYETLLSDTRIPAGEKRIEEHMIKEANIKYPIKATMKLNFRIYPQWVTDMVKKTYPALPNPTVIELNKIEKTFNKE